MKDKDDARNCMHETEVKLEGEGGGSMGCVKGVYCDEIVPRGGERFLLLPLKSLPNLPTLLAQQRSDFTNHVLLPSNRTSEMTTK